MKNPTSKSLTSRVSYHQRSALIVAVCAVILGLVVTGLLNVQAQNSSRPTAEREKQLPLLQQRVANTASQSVNVSWPNGGRKRLTYGDYLLSLKGNEGMTAKVISIRPSNDGNPTAVIVIYDKDGKVRMCIGGAAACKLVAS